MNIALRVDASNRIGFGHLIRCRTLATALRDQDAEVGFLCRAHPGHGIAMLEADGFMVASLPEPPAARVEIADADYAGWLGVRQPQDAIETRTALGNWRPDWLIVDHYGLDRDWEQTLRLGHQDRVTSATLREAVLSLVSDPVRRRVLSMAGTELVDGEGAMRVIEAMQQRG